MTYLNKELIDRLRAETFRSVRALDTADSPAVLLDFPDHANVGDSAIYAGQMAFFDATKPLRYVCTTRSVDWADVDRYSFGGTIYLSGGGNFGDLWPHFQEFREDVITRFPDRTIIQLPQSIHFGDESNALKTAQILGNHPNFTLLVRDVDSLRFAERTLRCDARLCPDMAFCLGPLSAQAPQIDLLLHLRTDQEAREQYASVQPRPNYTLERSDWPEEGANFRKFNNLQGALKIAAGALTGGRPGERITRYRHRATTRLDRGVALLGKAKAIVTDRLHGHILATLIGRPHVALDNSYGKISRFASTWSTLDPTNGMAASLPEAVERALLHASRNRGFGPRGSKFAPDAVQHL